jgi:hypothetical protein
MQKLLIGLIIIGITNAATAQKATIKIVKGSSDLKVPLLPPPRNVIDAVTVEFELTGKLLATSKDTIINFSIDDRSKNNNASLVDTALTILSSEWTTDGSAKKIKRDIYIRHKAVAEQKHDEKAYLYINGQEQEYHAIQFLSAANTPALAVAASGANTLIETSKKVAPDTFTYNKTFGYDNDANLFDLTIKKYEDKTSIQICSNEESPAAVKCAKRILFGEVSREKFDVVLKELLKKLPVPGVNLDATKISPKPDDQFVEYTAFLAKQKPKEANEIEKQLVVVNKKLEELFNEKANKKAIGYFKLVSPTVVIKNNEKGKAIPEKSAKIVSVEIVLSNGGIRKNGIKVELDNGQIYRNKQAPVTLFRIDNRKGDILYVDDKRTGKRCFYLELGDVINYIYKGKFSYPADETAYLTPEKTADTLYVGSTISELLDVNIYSDMLALLGRKPNGIIQTQITGTFITNTNNLFKNTDIIFHNFVKAYFRLSKYDSKFAQLDSTKFKGPALDSVNRLYLNQIAFLQAGLKTNIVRFGIGNNQQILLNAGAEISLTNADSLFKKDLVTINYYPEIEYIISRLDNFGLETSIKYLRQIAPANSPFKNKESIWIFNPQATIYYYPFSNPENKIYVRYAHFAQVGDARYNYPQFQFGFKTNLFAKKDKTQ